MYKQVLGYCNTPHNHPHLSYPNEVSSHMSYPPTLMRISLIPISHLIATKPNKVSHTSTTNLCRKIHPSYCTSTCLPAGENKVVVTAGGQQCILPFSHDGRTWWGCVTTSDRPSPWCAVRVDSAGVLTSWDYCDLDWGESGGNGESLGRWGAWGGWR